MVNNPQHVRPGLVWTGNSWQPRKPSPLLNNLQLTSCQTLITPGLHKSAAASQERPVLSENGATVATATAQLTTKPASAGALPPVASASSAQQPSHIAPQHAQPAVFLTHAIQHLKSSPSSQPPADAHVRVSISFPRRSADLVQQKQLALHSCAQSPLDQQSSQPAVAPHSPRHSNIRQNHHTQQHQQLQQHPTAAPEMSDSFEIRPESVSPSVSDAARRPHFPKLSKKALHSSASPTAAAAQPNLQQPAADGQPALARHAQHALLSHPAPHVSVLVAEAPAEVQRLSV